MDDIIFNPMIPVGAMAVICIILLCLKRRGVAPYIRQIIIIVLLFAINLRPMIRDRHVKVEQEVSKCKIIFVVDDTISMVAEDYDGKNPRFDGAKADIAYIIDEFPGAEYSIIDFNNDAQVLTPFTDDPEFAKAFVDSIAPVYYRYAFGTNLSVVKDTFEDVLESADERSDDPIYVFFISDGEITDDYALKPFDDLSEYIDGGAVLGYGTSKGGLMHVTDPYTGESEILMDERDYPYQPAISCIDENNLKKIAQELGISYVHMDRTDRIESTINNIKDSVDTDLEEDKREGYAELYFYLMIPLAVLVAYEFISVKRRG